MTAKNFNSVGGFSVNETANVVIDSNSNFSATGLTATGNVEFTGDNITLGQVVNVKILGGTSGQFITTDSNGNLSFTTLSEGFTGSQGDTGFVGSQGIQGDIGFTGSQGIIGLTGSQGIQGDTGFVGSQGIQGDIGLTGSQGIQGDTGFVGSQGIQGDIGLTGSQGVIGFTGSQGIQGDIGFTGSQGIQGVIGFTGSQGVQGDIGFTGSQGIQGDEGGIGFTGFTGSQGIQGVIGFTGSQGIQGVIGFTGSQGIQGVIGLTGSQGIQGDIGFTGSQGIQGDTGFVGSQGIQGDTGFVGSQGIQGDTGFVGSQGIQGVIGLTGSQGVQGDTGFVGSQGVQGDTGFVGSQGIQGDIGFTGSQGDIGFTGSQGDIGFTGSSGSANANGNDNFISKFANSTSLIDSQIFDNGSNVGIGTTSPIATLEVSGNIRATNATFTGAGSFGANVNMNSFNINNLVDPVASKDAATKDYVDGVAQGLKARTSAKVKSDTNLASTYDNGTAGQGATLTASSSVVFPDVDGILSVELNVVNMRILVNGQTNSAHNGLYVLDQIGIASTQPWILRRCTECDTSDKIPGSFVFVSNGDIYANTGWTSAVDLPFIIGTDDINWTQFSGAGTFTAGTGLTLTGSEFSVDAAQPGITSIGTLTSLNVNGSIIATNITANTGVFTGNGSGLTSLTGANVTGTVANATFATTAGTVTTAAQPNITSVGTLTLLNVSGNANVGNIGATNFVGSGASLTSLNASNLSSGTVPSARLSGAYSISVTSATFAGTVTTAAQPNITSVGTLTLLNVSGNANVGNIGATNFVGSGASLTSLNASNLASGTVPSARLSGAYSISVTSATTAGTVTTAAQPNITSVGTLTSLTISGTNNLLTRRITTGAASTTGIITGNWSLAAGSKLNATYADLAECYVADNQYLPGTVLLFAGEYEVSAKGIANSHAVAGVVSTNPAYLMNAGCKGKHVVELALIGRVPCKVQGPVVKGDLIVSSEKLGYGKVNNNAKAGTIIGKALSSLEDTDGIVEVLVGRS